MDKVKKASILHKRLVPIITIAIFAIILFASVKKSTFCRSCHEKSQKIFDRLHLFRRFGPSGRLRFRTRAGDRRHPHGRRGWFRG